MSRQTALVAGGLGVIGRALVEELAQRPEWDVVALSRRAPDFDTPVRYLSVDLLDAGQCAERLSGLAGVTHLFYCALSSGPGAWDRPANRQMLVNLVEVAEAATSDLAHVSLMQGSSYYGFHSPGGGTTLRLTGDLIVHLNKIPGLPKRFVRTLGPRVERYLIDQVIPNLKEVPAAVQSFLDQA